MAKKILVVDDEPDAMELIKFILKGAGFEVLAARSGEECLKVLGKETPDLVLLDVMMPEMNGFKVFDKIRKTLKEHRVAFLTVVDAPEQERKVLANKGAVDYITKPFSKEELITRVKRALTLERGKDY